MSLGTHPSPAFSRAGGTSWRPVGEDQVPHWSAGVWSFKPFGERRRGLEKGFIFSSDQDTPHRLEMQVWSSTKITCMSLSCTNRSVRFRTVKTLWYPVRLNFNPVLKQCFVELSFRSVPEELIRRSDASSSSPVALHRTLQLILLLRPAQIIVTLTTVLKKHTWHSYLVLSQSALFFVLV